MSREMGFSTKVTDHSGVEGDKEFNMEEKFNEMQEQLKEKVEQLTVINATPLSQDDMGKGRRLKKKKSNFLQKILSGDIAFVTKGIIQGYQWWNAIPNVPRLVKNGIILGLSHAFCLVPRITRMVKYGPVQCVWNQIL